MKLVSKLALFATVLIALASCKTVEVLPDPEPEPFDPDKGKVKGFYLLNEGPMGANKATLDYCSLADGTYTKDIFAKKNPALVQGLGDVGNDVKAYGNKLYTVVNNSNLVEISDLTTGKHLENVSIPQCRNVAFEGKYAYVTAYGGRTEGNKQYGIVTQIDTTSLRAIKSCEVGFQPEQIVSLNSKLYVVNSGWQVDGYDNRLIVIDAATLEIEKEYEIAVNMTKIVADDYGILWIISNGDYNTIPASLYAFDTNSNTFTNTNISAAAMTVCGDSLYFYNSSYDPVTWAATFNYGIINVKSKSKISDKIITDGTESAITTPYCIAVNPTTRDIFITDAKDYTLPGSVHCYSKAGVLKWSQTTGIIPGSIAFTTKALQ